MLTNEKAMEMRGNWIARRDKVMKEIETKRDVIFSKWLNERCIVSPVKQEKTLTLFKDWDAWARGLPPDERPSLTPTGTLAVYGAPATFVKKMTALGFGRKRFSTASYITGVELNPEPYKWQTVTGAMGEKKQA